MPTSFQNNYLSTMKSIQPELRMQLDEIKAEFEDLQRRIAVLEERTIGKLSELSEQQTRQRQLYLLDELNRMFCYYIAESKIGCTWESFKESVHTMKAMLEDNEITEEEFTHFILPHNSSLGFDVATLIGFRRNYHFFDCPDIRSVTNQKELINVCKRIRFDDDLKAFVDEMVRQLDSPEITYRRVEERGREIVTV